MLGLQSQREKGEGQGLKELLLDMAEWVTVGLARAHWWMAGVWWREKERDDRVGMRASCGRLGLLRDFSKNGRSQAWSASLGGLVGQTGEFLHNCLREEHPAVRESSTTGGEERCFLPLAILRGHIGLLWGERAAEGKTWAV